MSQESPRSLAGLETGGGASPFLTQQQGVIVGEAVPGKECRDRQKAAVCHRMCSWRVETWLPRVTKALGRTGTTVTGCGTLPLAVWH